MPGAVGEGFGGSREECAGREGKMLPNSREFSLA